MRKIHILILIIVSVCGCNDEPKFPDPGFDLISDKDVTVRRDTADSFTIYLNINAPGGIDYIQILNGRDFEVIDEINEYKNKKKLEFQYTFDFSPIEKSKDTILIYNLRVVTNDNKAYNSSYVIDLKKLSIPEVLFPTNIIGTNMELINLQCEITTGIYMISEIEVYINDEKKYTTNNKEIGEVSEYALETLIQYPFLDDIDYELKMIVKDSKNQVTTEYKTIRKIRLKKPKSIEMSTMGNIEDIYELLYDSQDRLIKIIYNPSFEPLYFAQTTEIHYRQDNLVGEIHYYNHYNENRTRISVVEFTYIDGRVTEIFHGSRGINNPDDKREIETLQNIVHREDGTIQKFNFSASTMEEVQYTNGFQKGEKIFCESFDNNIIYLNLSKRQVKTGFVPIKNPVYIEKMPQIWFLDENTNDLFWYQYIYLENNVGYNSTPDEYNPYHKYSYECDEYGQLISFTKKKFGQDNIGYHQVFTFIYE